MNNLLMKSILAMDSYNRGYNATIDLRKKDASGAPIPFSDIVDASLGKGSIIDDSGVFKNPNQSRQDQSISFYAVAYSYNGEKIIFFRGTDDFSNDLLYGYTVGTGFPNHQQAEMAFGFYNVIADGVDPRTANISLVGHSLGGGLAGLVAGVQ